MAVEIVLSTTPEGNVLATHTGQPLGTPAPLAELPRITADSNPYRFSPVELGARLYASLGGQALVDLLDADDDRLLYLVTDEAAAGVPWEYAATPDGDFLACRYGFLRLLPHTTTPPHPPGCSTSSRWPPIPWCRMTSSGPRAPATSWTSRTSCRSSAGCCRPAKLR